MAGQIKLTPAELRASATKYTQGATEVRQVLQKLSNEQNVIRANWSGSSFQKFDAQFTSLKPKVTQFAELLDQINQQLVSVADIIEQTDAQIASKINTL